MSITSFPFFLFLAAGVILYYLLPGKIQWVVLLLLSLVYYGCSKTPYTLVYLLISTAAAYFAGVTVRKQRESGSENKRLTFWVTMAAILINLVLWFFFKARGLWAPIAVALLNRVYIGPLNTAVYGEWIPALGMGYYTLQVIGYIIDCYWDNAQAQRNPLKLFLFTSYFPQLTTGPISTYEQLSPLYERHQLSYQNLAFGCQRILWGLMKKLVLAERMAIFLTGLREEVLYGYQAWLIILLYPIQMYADFSGCMDIVLGASELFGIHLPENFNNPFFSRSSQEFWQRWHITLGTWAKNYVLYPLLKSNFMVRLNKKARKRFGKKTGKFLVNALAMFVLWTVMGVWHGEWKHIVGVSLWYWVILMLGELCGPALKKLTQVLQINTENFSWHLFQSCRTYLIYAFGAVFFGAGISGAVDLFKKAGEVIFYPTARMPWAFFDGSLGKYGLGAADLNLIILCVGLLLLVGCLREKYGYARVWVQKQGFVLRWMIWIALFLLVLIWGKYGPGYSAAEFIYQGF